MLYEPEVRPEELKATSPSMHYHFGGFKEHNLGRSPTFDEQLV